VNSFGNYKRKACAARNSHLCGFLVRFLEIFDLLYVSTLRTLICISQAVDLFIHLLELVGDDIVEKIIRFQCQLFRRCLLFLPTLKRQSMKQSCRHVAEKQTREWHSEMAMRKR
jgi:hypothetical protein